MKQYIKGSSNSKLLSVFWYVNGEFVGPEDTIDGESVIQYGDYLQLDIDHEPIWLLYKPADVPYCGYTKYPRGRIFFNIAIHKFIVIADPKIVDNETIRNKLLEYYGLPNTTIFKTDEHYRSEVDV